MDATGAIMWKATYRPFGETMIDSGSTSTNNLRFPGQYLDQESGLHYNWHRDYDAKTGRYLTSDPVGILAGINLFVYVDNRPLMNIDPFGLWVHGFGIGASGCFFAAGSGGLLIVSDNVDNWGIAFCGSGGVGIGKGFIAGVQISVPRVERVCDLEGFTVRREGWSVGGAFATARGGVAIDAGAPGVNAIVGVGRGGWGAAGNIASGCKLLWNNKVCRQSCEEKEIVVGKIDGSQVRYIREGSESVRWRIPSPWLEKAPIDFPP
jgi:RHS repeat-associated protein